MHRLIILSVFTLILYVTQGSSVKLNNENLEKNCGYGSCNPTKEGYVNVHLVPHSHDDVGWVKTLDQFYYGTRSDLYRAGVMYIYDNVLKSVQKNKDRKFIYVETAFFWKWWQDQEEAEKEALRELVNNGQIEFISGGWSMNDEAVCHYQSIIDNMAWGLKKLNDTLGECARPKMGWQIDPFGHSSEMASIFASLGFDGVILGRIDFQDLQVRLNNKSMEMVWRGSSTLGRSSDIFTSVQYGSSPTPSGFCFDILCSAVDFLVDNVNSPEYNIDKKATDFIMNHVEDEHLRFQTSNVIVPMGNDFAYQESEMWFKNMDKLIKYTNTQEVFNGTKYHLFYSTPSCYVAAVHKESNGTITSPLKTDDFMPYGSDPHSFWTGYYTSRPTLKRFERMGNNFLQICKQLYSITNVTSEYEPKLDSLREAMGVLQHHDAITGTEKEVVAYDYSRLLDIGIKNCENITNQALSTLTNVTSGFETCLLLNVSQCAFSENAEAFVVTVYNPLSREINKFIRLPVLGTAYIVTSPNGTTIENELIPIHKAVQSITGRDSNATVELLFEAENIPPLGYKSFYIEKTTGNDVILEDISDSQLFGNPKQIVFIINPTTGILKNIIMEEYALEVDQRFFYYNGSNGWDQQRPSGAYIFRPDKDYPIANVSNTATYEIYRGNLVVEFQQRFNEFVSQTMKIYKNEKFIEFDWIIGPLIINDTSPYGKEVISRFSTNLNNSDSTFYTDSNGRAMLKRVRNFRQTWDITGNETEASNYYPITSKIVIQDEAKNLQLAVMTDRAQGGSSLEDGQVELMLLRNAVADDQLGVGEALQEKAFDQPLIVRGSHYVNIGPITKTMSSGYTLAAIQKGIAERKLLDSWIFLSSPAESSFAGYQEQHPMEFSGLSNALPQNVHILTLEPWGPSGFLLRLEHTFDLNEDPKLSLPVSVDLKGLFTTFEITSLKETTLGGNQWLEDNQRLNFSSIYQSDAFQEDDRDNQKEWADDLTVTLDPMQIRTFVITIEVK